LIERSYGGKTPLEQLHKIVPEGNRLKELVGIDDDNRTWLHKQFYGQLNAGWPELVELYDNFIREVLLPIISEDPFLSSSDCKFAYQKFPTFRVQVPGNFSVGEFHKDSDYNHPLGEINFVVPLTDADSSASIWAESSPGKKDYSPLPMKAGNIIMFDGNMGDHGNKINAMETCRVSLDFRVLPMKYHDPDSPGGSVDLGRKFIVGDYYSSAVLEI
jgi:hypothetical protein